jgi:hypothetical protein
MSILLSFRGLLNVTKCRDKGLTCFKISKRVETRNQRYDWSVVVIYVCKDEDYSIEGRDVIEIKG